MHTSLILFGVGIVCVIISAILGYLYANNKFKKDAAIKLVGAVNKEIERRDKHASEVKAFVSACNTSRAKVSSRVRKVTSRKTK